MSQTAVQPRDFTRRSFVYQKLLALGARFGEVNDAAVALAYGDETPAHEAEQARSLGLVDLSPLTRCGFKGAGSAEWLAGQGVEVPGESNRAAQQSDSCLAARLAPGEVLLLGDLAGTSTVPARLLAAWEADEAPGVRGFPVPRQDSHAWFAVSGEHAAAMFSKLCGVDLRPRVFDDGAIAQTSVARLNAIIIRRDMGSTPSYHLLPDSASAAYLWDCLTDAMSEFRGAPVGLEALRQLAGAA